MKRKVILEGELGEKFGREFTINAESFKDVLHCLNSNFPSFKQYLLESEEKDVGFTCQVGEAPLTDERELLLGYPEGAMIISTVPAGSKSGIGKIFAAIAIVAIMLTPGLREYFMTTQLVAVGTGASATFATSLTTLGLITSALALNLALTGLQQLMAPDPSTDSQQSDESYLFQGTGQEAIEGDPVPLVYGKLRVPGRPISVEVKNERQAFINIATVSEPPTPTGQVSAVLPPSQQTISLGQTQTYNVNLANGII